jgi:hypothetical protein
MIYEDKIFTPLVSEEETPESEEKEEKEEGAEGVE